VVILGIIKDLIKAASCYFTSGIILKHFKKFIIVVLCKKGKKNSFLISYKLIAFKNILIKILKKYIANIIFKAVEKYKLLP